MTDETDDPADRGGADDTDAAGATDDIPRDDFGDPLPPLNADKTPAPAALSSSFGEEVPRDA